MITNAGPLLVVLPQVLGVIVALNDARQKLLVKGYCWRIFALWGIGTVVVCLFL